MILQKSRKEKLKTIRGQILVPFLAITLLLPLMIIGIFNLAINIYVDNTTKEDLSTTRKTAYSLMKAAVEEDVIHDASQKHSVNEAAQLLLSALTASRLSGNTDFLLLYQGKVAYPKDPTHSIISYNAAQKMNIAKIPTDEKIYIKKVDGTTYYLTATKLETYQDFPDVTMLFVSNTKAFDEMISTLNIYLFLAMLLVISVAIYVFAKISKKISSPITYAARLAITIGNGEFVDVPVNDSCEEIMQLTTSLNDMSSRLKEAESVQKKFIQNASHELRTPLMSIQGYAEGIENHIVTDTTGAAIIIKQESIRMKKLVDELLTLSRIENQSHNIKLKSANITNLLLDFIQNINGMALKKHIRIDTHMQESVIANVDETLLSQVVLNIMSNCIQYAKTKVLVTTRSENGKAIINIIDDGDGFCSEDIDHVFDRFYKGKKGNFGLGLSIAYSAVQYMNGSITAKNAPDSGALFTIEFKEN